MVQDGRVGALWKMLWYVLSINLVFSNKLTISTSVDFRLDKLIIQVPSIMQGMADLFDVTRQPDTGFSTEPYRDISNADVRY